MKPKILAGILAGAALAAAPSWAITFGPFGPFGEGGSKNGQDLRIGPGGSVYELDAFLHVGGLDLNGTEPGGAACLSRHRLPAGLNSSFGATPTNGATGLVLTYSFSNATENPFTDLRFFVLLDAEIDQATNTFFNEYGVLIGPVGRGAWDAAPDQWQIDEPGFRTGTLIRNLFLGALSNSNAVPQTAPNDVALGLGFLLGTLKPAETVTVQVMISENGATLGAMALAHQDPASPATVITLSGQAESREAPFVPVTEQVRFGLSWRLNWPTGSLLGTLSLTNPPGHVAVFGPPFHLGLRPSTNFWFRAPHGTNELGQAYLDLTAAISARAGPNGVLDPGETVVLVDGVDLFSRDRSPPPLSLFEFWATQQR